MKSPENVLGPIEITADDANFGIVDREAVVEEVYLDIGQRDKCMRHMPLVLQPLTDCHTSQCMTQGKVKIVR
ncbi:hypothetical protein C5B96_03685 [Subtercola sp. Z020]|nr:hypothetical protein C5B96_03685 [Subtercola sp. Z020]